MGKCSVVPMAPESESPFVVGTYRGNTSSAISVKVGFKPKLLFLLKTSGGLFQETTYGTDCFAILSSENSFSIQGGAAHISLVNDGFFVTATHSSRPWNDGAFTYTYIAFR